MPICLYKQGFYILTQFIHFKKKGAKDSFRIPLPCRVDYSEWKVKIAKLGWVKIYKGHNKQINGTIKSYTISRTSTDRYYISILYETADRVKLGNNMSVGIDLGIKSFAVLSSGEVFENQKYLKQNLAKLKALQRSASRKYQVGKKREDQSKNWKKAMMKAMIKIRIGWTLSNKADLATSFGR